MIIRYARVSTEGQTLESQIEHLNQVGCGKIYSETTSGAKTDRRELRRCLAALRPGDVLVVTRLDRLARSTRDLLNVLAEIGERSAAFRSLTDTWADTTTPHGRLMLTVLGGLAEFERELIKARTGDRRTRAKARGVKFGRKSVLSADQRAYIAKLRAEGESVRHIARIMGVSAATIGRVPPS
ncbi:recombinase family protein [Xanthobacter agilis]|jgi:DNA invertase Pin-like site-specific DNA recombinase|uniref:DNA invertase Pin-like site-specific DNA recombinase n=1 Tax=Xanthobacter agilis TaxID=47492 RepID=A0ABU0LKD7_XANAG|nr:recombinase family protein [Xanthobacter agilis]MDQ0507554.1 DNA invertase Pin-like site-specific DNA recombinase [Xanthobacter agilis]